MKLYFAPRSRAVRIAWLLEELGLEYELEYFKVGDKILRSAEYKKFIHWEEFLFLKMVKLQYMSRVQSFNISSQSMIMVAWRSHTKTPNFQNIFNGYTMQKGQ